MKTTLEISDSLLRRAKVLAASRGISLGELGSVLIPRARDCSAAVPAAVRRAPCPPRRGRGRFQRTRMSALLFETCAKSRTLQLPSPD